MLKIKMARRAVVVFAVATTLAGVVPAQAAVTSHISTAFSGSFHGKITSASAHCVAGRTVKLFRHTASGDQLVGTTSSNSHGSWKISLMQARGAYFAKTPAQTEHGTACGGAKSNTVHV